MRQFARLVSLCVVVSSLAVHGLVLAQIQKEAPSSEQPGDDVSKQPPSTPSYGFCNGPQNADTFPSSPIPVEETKCNFVQKYTATSVGPSTSAPISCGGYTVVFGPKGDLKPNLYHVILAADWGDTPLTSSTCAKAKLAAVAWGERCTNDACTTSTWQKISGPKQRTGSWNATNQACYIGIQFSQKDKDKKYKTLNLDIITTLLENNQTVRKRAKGTITALIGNGKCISAPAQR
jgi:hypothetical protein